MEVSLFRIINDLAGRSATLDGIGIFLADYLGYFLLAAALILVMRQSQRFAAFALLVLSVLLSRGLITELIRFFIHRPRPFAVMNVNLLVDPIMAYSFPSGHAAIGFAMALVVWQLNRRWGWWFLAGALLVALARVFVGVHWPLDILAGALIGLLSVLLVKYLLPKSES